MIRRMTALTLTTAVTLVQTVAAQDRSVRYEPARWDNIASERERNEAIGMEVIYIDNRSDEPIIVRTIKLVECQNLRTRCGVHKLKVRVGPRERKAALRVSRRERDQFFTFGYSFTWTPEATDQARAEQAKAADEATPEGAFTPADWASLLLTTQDDEVADRRLIMLENRSDEAVIVTSVVLSNCMNLYTACGRHALEIVVAPKEKKRLLAVRFYEGLANSFQHTFEWRRAEDSGREPRR